MTWVRALCVWVLLALLMVAHGTLRERFATPRLGELRAHQWSCGTAALLIVAVAWACLGWMGIAGSPALQLRVGLLWLGATVAFEFGFGRWVAGHSWQRLLADYDLRAGRLWVLVLLVTACAPRIAGWLDAAAAG